MQREEYRQYMEMASRLATRGDIEKAIRIYKSVTNNYPRHIGGYYNLALLYYSQDMTDEAIENFEKAAQLDPVDASIFNNLGALYYSKGLLKKAEINLKKAVEIVPNYADALRGLGRIYRKYAEQGDPQKLEQYTDYIKDKIEKLCQRDKMESAQTISRDLTKLMPDDPEIHRVYAMICYKLSKMEEARIVIARARELSPDDADILDSYRTIYSAESTHPLLPISSI